MSQGIPRFGLKQAEPRLIIERAPYPHLPCEGKTLVDEISLNLLGPFVKKYNWRCASREQEIFEHVEEFYVLLLNLVDGTPP